MAMIPGSGASQYSEYTDEQLAARVNDGDNAALDTLFDRYKNFVRIKARSYFLIGAGREDIIQEGMIGLYKAIRDFLPERQPAFRMFAELCVTRQIITAIKTATRQKHMPLNSYISFSRPVREEDSERTLLDVLTLSGAANPEELVIGQEDLRAAEHRIAKTLSAFEAEVLSEYLGGRSYHEIAAAMGRDAKSVDNALQRIKRKLEKVL